MLGLRGHVHKILTKRCTVLVKNGQNREKQVSSPTFALEAPIPRVVPNFDISDRMLCPFVARIRRSRDICSRYENQPNFRTGPGFITDHKKSMSKFWKFRKYIKPSENREGERGKVRGQENFLNFYIEKTSQK